MKSTSNRRVEWYRTPLDKETLARLNAKSDFLGLMQCLGPLAILAATAFGAVYGLSHHLWALAALSFFCYGTVASFAINAVHELGHKSVFKSQKLNQFFLRIYAFHGWIHFEHFYNSHMRHHQFTLHQPDDLEVTLPIKVLTKNFFLYGFFNYGAFKWHVPTCLRLGRGDFKGEWELKLFPPDQPEKALPIRRWARFLLWAHGTVIASSLILAVVLGPIWLMLAVLVSLTPSYGGWLHFLCNNTQHIGLQDDVPDFRLCCRTFTVNPLVQFIYWHMNFHIEHHMYAAVPCYKLKQLHNAIKHELPPTPHGLISTWKEIADIQRKQCEDPEFQYVAPIPGRSAGLGYSQ